ncbi:MAG: RNA polymerase sporulation sigma factor SigK [Bacilli bacterium]|nr:RNA polymerase sporulation sigma factor SigK [Bacilli bacterium]MBR2997671.1 RNA polymerase sporulation sigma factor SigK [Bacilli bacterium]
MFLFELVKSIFCFTGSYSNDVFLKPLSSKEEEECIKKKMEGDRDARNKLIEHNLRLVAHIVKKYDDKLCDTDDLIGIGTIGLIKGVDTFSIDKGVKITTYCARCIENEILMYFRKNNKYLKDVSINDQVGFDKDGNEIEIMDLLKVENTSLIDEISLKDNIKSLYKYIDVLTPREKKIIIHRYGLYNENEETQKSISKKLGISRSYVSRIEKRALTKLLREFIKNEKI